MSGRHGITPSRMKIAAFVQQTITTHGRAPTVSEIREYMGYKSKSNTRHAISSCCCLLGDDVVGQILDASRDCAIGEALNSNPALSKENSNG